MPKSKVVILNWNGADCLRCYLPTVIAATPPEVGIVVADNGSTDDSVALLEREFPTVERLLLDRNYGFAEGYNRALRQIEADYYILLNSDVETPAGWIEPLLRCLDEQPDVAACAPKLHAVTERDRFEYAGAAGGFIDRLGYPFCRGRILRRIETDCGQYDTPCDAFWVSGAAFCCRAEVFHALGGFDGDFFAHMEEIDLCWRMQLAGWRIMAEPRSVVHHLGGGTLAADSPAKCYLNYRNNLAMLIKCASPVQRCCVALVRPLTDGAAALGYLLGGHPAKFRAVVRAWRDFLRDHGRLLARRREIRAAAKKVPTGIYRGSIVVRYLLGGRRFGQMM